MIAFSIQQVILCALGRLRVIQKSSRHFPIGESLILDDGQIICRDGSCDSVVNH